MTKASKAAGEMYTKKAALDDMPSFADLNKAIALLKRGEKLDDASRRFIIDALDYLYVALLIERRLHKRGRRENIVITLFAAVVKELHDKHGIKIAAAVSAMVTADWGTEDSRRKLRQSIERAYRTLRASGRETSVSEKRVLEALARINPPKTGNK